MKEHSVSVVTPQAATPAAAVAPEKRSDLKQATSMPGVNMMAEFQNINTADINARLQRMGTELHELADEMARLHLEPLDAHLAVIAQAQALLHELAGRVSGDGADGSGSAAPVEKAKRDTRFMGEFRTLMAEAEKYEAEGEIEHAVHAVRAALALEPPGMLREAANKTLHRLEARAANDD